MSASTVNFGDLSACGHCGRASPNLHRCTRCHQQAYCNTKCQRAHYKAHKLACKAFAAGGGPSSKAPAPAANTGTCRPSTRPTNAEAPARGVSMTTTASGGCPNAEHNKTRYFDASEDDYPPHVIPDVTFRRGEFILQYKDRRPGRPPLMGRLDPDEDDEDKAEDGRLSQLTLRLSPFCEVAINDEGHYVPKIPLPSKMIMANDVKDGGRMPNMTEEETIACLLNAYNVRHYVHKRAQVTSKGKEFVISIEYDVRQSGDRVKFGQKSVNEASLGLTVTLRSDGMEAGFPDVHRKYFLYFSDADEEENPPEVSFEPATEWIGQSMARPWWARQRPFTPGH